MRHPFPADQLDHLCRIHLPQAYMPRAHGRHRPGETPAVAVEQRQRPKINGIRPEPVLEHLAQRVQISAPMRVHHAFGSAGGSAGVIDRNHSIFVINRRRIGERGLALRQKTLVVIGGHRQVRLAIQYWTHRRPQLRVGDQHLGPAVPQNPLQLARLQADVQHHQHSPCQRHAKVRLERSHAVGRQNGHPISRHDAVPPQRRREPVNPLLEFQVCEAAFAIRRGSPVGIDIGAAREKIERRERRFHRFDRISPRLPACALNGPIPVSS